MLSQKIDFTYYTSAIHSTEISIPAGKGITCGVLLAGAFSVNISLYTLFKILNSFPETINTVVFTIFSRLLPISSRIVLMFRKDCLACSSKLSLNTQVVGLKPVVPDTNINLPAITACGNTSVIRGTLVVLKFFLVSILYVLNEYL